MRVALFVLCLAAVPTSAAGQEPPPEAREFYERGQAAYVEGRYREAIENLERAYALDPQGTVLLYNIGLIYEKLGEIDEAVDYYERYLQHDVEVEERERVEGIVSRLRGARAEVEARDPEPSPSGLAASQPPTSSRLSAPAPPPAEYGRADVLFWLTGAAALGATAVGSAFGVMAIANDRDAEALVASDADDLARRRDLAGTADDQALLADIAFGGALVLGTTAALLYFLRESEQEPQVSVSPARDGGWLAVRVEVP